MRNSKVALLLSGGIGDFVHYISRISDFLTKKGLAPERVEIFVESTRPNFIKPLFLECLPEFQLTFLPGAIHWTKTNPLLSVDSSYERKNRAAYQYVAREGFSSIEDWFLPFLTSHYEAATHRLRQFTSDAESRVIISARDKGFIWWPSREALDGAIECIPEDNEIIIAGTQDETLTYVQSFTCYDNVLDALRSVCTARLFVGTDTGFATIRELLGLPNIYCINEYWFENLMVRYEYWTNELESKSESKFVYNSVGLEEEIVGFFKKQQRRKKAFAINDSGAHEEYGRNNGCAPCYSERRKDILPRIASSERLP